MYLINQTIIWSPSVYLDHNFTDTTVQSAGAPYTFMFSIYHFNIYATDGVTYQAMYANTFQADPTTFTIRVFASGINLYTLGVQGFIISNSLLNNVKLKNILLISAYGITTLPGDFNAVVVYNYPGVVLARTNTFLGLYYFFSFNNSLIYEYDFTNGQISLSKTSYNPAFMAVFILTALRNYCSDPFSYDGISQSCLMCMPNCGSCDLPECLQCALNFTLAADKLSCYCSDEEVSDICYAFNSSNMKGCVSATVDSSNIITCMMCSIT